MLLSDYEVLKYKVIIQEGNWGTSMHFLAAEAQALQKVIHKTSIVLGTDADRVAWVVLHAAVPQVELCVQHLRQQSYSFLHLAT